MKEGIGRGTQRGGSYRFDRSERTILSTVPVESSVRAETWKGPGEASFATARLLSKRQTRRATRYRVDGR